MATPPRRRRAKAPADTLTIVYQPLAALRPYARNARTHSKEQTAKIKRSLMRYGWTNPMLIADGEMIAGHGRLAGALELLAEGKKPKLTPSADVGPTIDLSHLSLADRRAYALADNRLALDAGWDEALLADEIAWLRAEDFDLGLTGFEADETDSLLAGLGLPSGAKRRDGEGLTDPDDAPEPPADPVSVLGDVWLLGRHRLMCGDSTDPLVIERLMAGKEADLCFTSPPYGQQRDYKTGIADWDALMQGVFSILPVKHGAQVLVNLGLIHRDGEWIPYWDGWISWMRNAGWRRFGWYVWDQGPGLPGDWNGRLAPSHEWVFHFNREAERARKTKDKDPRNIKLKSGTGMRRADGSMSGVSSPRAGLQPTKIPDSVVRVMRHKGGLGNAGSHPAPFPVDLPGEFINAFSDPDDIVYEPFCGSGTQLIAAQKNGRSCYAVEIAPAYVDVAVKRWQAYTGAHATLEDDGRAFEDIATERSGDVPAASPARTLRRHARHRARNPT